MAPRTNLNTLNIFLSGEINSLAFVSQKSYTQNGQCCTTLILKKLIGKFTLQHLEAIVPVLFLIF